MILYALDIPETQEERIAWLERHVTGLHLSDLVAELRAVHRPQESLTFEQIAGAQLNGVLESGFTSLDEQQFQTLLTHPDCLFELQEMVLISGSTHWEQATDVVMKFDAGVITQAEQPTVSTTPTDAPAVTPASAAPSGRAWYSHPLLVSVLTAAVVLVAVNLNQKPIIDPVGPTGPPVVAKQGWGWDRPGALKSDVTPVVYLNGLADSAEEWFKKRPDNARDVAVRIAQFRQGCSTLILADHGPLADEDKTWLVDKCRAWAGKLDEHLAAVEAGDAPSEVLDAADTTVRKLIIAIRTRADGLTA